MGQVSTREYRAYQVRVARGFAAVHARLNDLQRHCEAQGLAIKEALHLSTEQMARFRARVDALHEELSAAAGIGAGLANLGACVFVPGDYSRPMTFAELGALELEAHPVPPAAEFDLYDLVGPDPEARPRGVLARWLGKRAA